MKITILILCIAILFAPGILAQEDTLKLFNGSVVTGKVERFTDGSAKVTTAKGIRSYTAGEVTGINSKPVNAPVTRYFFGVRFSDEDLTSLHESIIHSYYMMDGKLVKLNGEDSRWIQGKVLSVVDYKTVLLANGSKVMALDLWSTKNIVDNQVVGYPAMKLKNAFRYTTIAGAPSQVEQWIALEPVPYQDFLSNANLLPEVKSAADVKKAKIMESEYAATKPATNKDADQTARRKAEQAARNREFWRMK